MEFMEARSFEENSLIIVAIVSGCVGIFSNVFLGYPWIPSEMDKSVPFWFTLALGVGTPTIVALSAATVASFRERSNSKWASPAATAGPFVDNPPVLPNTAAGGTASIITSAAKALPAPTPGRDLPLGTPTAAPPSGAKSPGGRGGSGGSSGSGGDGGGGGCHDQREVMGIPWLPAQPVSGRLVPTADDEVRLRLLEQRLVAEFTPEMVAALRTWAGYNKGLRAVLLQFSRARPGKQGPEDVGEAFKLLARAARWRHAHDIPACFGRGYPAADHHALKQRFLNAFFFGSSAPENGGEVRPACSRRNNTAQIQNRPGTTPPRYKTAQG